MRGYFFRSWFSPNLYRMYGEATGNPSQIRAYVPSSTERYGSNVITAINGMFSVGYYTSPFLLTLACGRDWFNLNGLILMLEIFAGFTTLYTTSLFLRAVGRSSSDRYRLFLDVLGDAEKDFTKENKARLGRYDFEFRSWPVEFQSSSPPSLDFVPHPEQRSISGPGYALHRLLAYCMVHTFGIALVYPGSTSLLNLAISEALSEGRAKLVNQRGGERFKLKTCDGNEIDTMFFEKRNRQEHDPLYSPNGSVLVITCEGNAGFYEVGMATTPIEAGYSVLGWNHPGFGGSTGTPLPDQEANAVDTVMQFAINKLGFSPSNILIHGWSIGGFTTSWAASHYPDIKGVILDATFDELLPLAIPRMPEVMSTLIKVGVVNHINLNVAEQLMKYNGPILLIRRYSDEMITTDGGYDVSTNRGNFLLKKLLNHRYPSLFSSASVVKALDEFLAVKQSSQRDILQRLNESASKFQTMVATEGASVGDLLETDQQKVQLALFLASKYMVEFDSSHCTPLPFRYFTRPWDPESVDTGDQPPPSSASSTQSEELSQDEASFVKL